MHARVDPSRLPWGSSSAADPLLIKAAAFSANPSFPAALRAYTASFIGFRQNGGLVNKIVSYHARWCVAAFLLYLHADRERFGPDGGATYGRFLAMCGGRPEVSKWSLKTLLALLQLSGMVTTVARHSTLGADAVR